MTLYFTTVELLALALLPLACMVAVAKMRADAWMPVTRKGKP